MIDFGEKRRFLVELLVAELLAKKGQGPLARPVWPRPRPRLATPRAAAASGEPKEPSAR